MPDETDVPAPDSSSGESTITKGYVEGKDGSRITLTETRDADGNLTRATETETDADGNITSQTTYEGGTGEGRTTPAPPICATRNPRPMPTWMWTWPLTDTRRRTTSRPNGPGTRNSAGPTVP
jgi:hypothetical protein